MTDRKQEGSMKRSRALPRRVREVRVDRSKRSHLWETKEAALRARTSEMAAIMFERITSGKSLMVVVEETTIFLVSLYSIWQRLMFLKAPLGLNLK